MAAHFDATTEVTLNQLRNELRIELSCLLGQVSDAFFRAPVTG
ncbi:hypothetical protein ACQP2P_44150 [Dactylosporangium sp. CA-139114]